MDCRYIIGIDLGTSNSSLAYIDTLLENPQSETMPCPQWQSPGVERLSEILPSFLYLPVPEEKWPPFFPDAADEMSGAGLPSANTVVGWYARERMADLADRVVQSAKSWLCHRGADCSENFLPWGSDAIAQEHKLSPLVASALYLSHFKNVWDNSIARYSEQYRLKKQKIIITVPASFDASAQRLTLQAAQLAGFPAEVRLLEEPQAAFYHWLEQASRDQLSKLTDTVGKIGSRILVCDIGGGTTDFSLFQLTSLKPLGIKRLAVSNHILLGGDNIDLALAYHFESLFKAQGVQLATRQWSYLIHQARLIKERMFAEKNFVDQPCRISLPTAGRSLLAQVAAIEVDPQEVLKTVIQGFFPECQFNSALTDEKTGLVDWGLPYAKDSAVTRHLAHFLRHAASDSKSSDDESLAKTSQLDFVLYTGGTLKPDLLRTRLTAIINSWQNSRPVTVLENEQLDLGVSRGAAYFGYLLQNRHGLIQSGYAHGIYLELDPDPQSQTQRAVCLLPRGVEAGQTIELTYPHFAALVDNPVRFQTYFSTTRRDKAGDIILLNDEDFRPLPPIQTKLQFAEEGKRAIPKHIEVSVSTSVTELGLLQISCRYLPPPESKPGASDPSANEPVSWLLEFNLRDNKRPLPEQQTASEPVTAVNDVLLEKATEIIRQHFGKDKHLQNDRSPKYLLRDLESALEMPRSDWNYALLRALWEQLAPGLTRRSRSLQHEVAWLTLAGFVLRPGFGSPLDEHRIDVIWRLFHLGLSNPKERSALIQWWILWRRVAGGLSSDRQAHLLKSHESLLNKRGLEEPELLAMLVSLERLPLTTKIRLGDKIVKAILGSGKVSSRSHYFWCLGRLATRAPLYAGAEYVLLPHDINRWFTALEPLNWLAPENKGLATAFCQIARLVNNRYLDLTDELRMRIVNKSKPCLIATNKLESEQVNVDLLRQITEYIPLTQNDQATLFGDSLPVGLKLVTRD